MTEEPKTQKTETPLIGPRIQVPEDAYFLKKDWELIERRRRGLDASRAAQELEAQSDPYWMRCPKCGGSMSTTEFSYVRVDRCSQCQGLFLDRGELELIFEAHEPHRFFNAIHRLFDPGEITPHF